MNTEIVIAFLEAHGKKARVVGASVVEVEALYTQRLPNTETRAVFSQWERIPATIKAAKEWLGY